MVMHGYAEPLAALDDFLRHVDVGARRCRIARRMVVHEDDGRRRQFQCPPDHLARINRRVVYRSGLLHLVGDQTVFLIEEQKM